MTSLSDNMEVKTEVKVEDAAVVDDNMEVVPPKRRRSEEIGENNMATVIANNDDETRTEVDLVSEDEGEGADNGDEENKSAMSVDDETKSDDCISISSDEGDIVTYNWNWGANPRAYVLYDKDQEFRKFVEPYITLLMAHGKGCIEKYQRYTGTKDMPSVEMFWGYVFQLYVRHSQWKAKWMVIDPERRSWPFDRLQVGVMEVNDITYPDGPCNPTLTMKLIETQDSRFEQNVKYDFSDVPFWQLHFLESIGENVKRKVTPEDLSNARHIIGRTRRFYEEIYPPATSNHDDNINVFFGVPFYERMKLLYQIAFPLDPAAQQYSLSSTEREKIIFALKDYHRLKNAIMFMNILGSVKDAEGGQENFDPTEDYSTKILLTEMKLQRHAVELNFLLEPLFRPLINRSNHVFEDNHFSNYQTILVVKEISTNDFSVITKLMREHLKEAELPEMIGEKMRISTSLNETLRNCNSSTVVFIVSGNYVIDGLHKLEDGGSLIGLPINGVDVTISPTEQVGDVWLEFYSGQEPITIQNINFALNSTNDGVGTALLAGGSSIVTLINVNIRDTSAVPNGKFVPLKCVGEDAEVDLINCNFTEDGDVPNISTGVTIDKGDESNIEYEDEDENLEDKDTDLEGQEKGPGGGESAN